MSVLTRRPALFIAAATGLLLLLTSRRYGYHRDELYFVQAGRHLAWGYPDQPPLVCPMWRGWSGSWRQGRWWLFGSLRR